MSFDITKIDELWKRKEKALHHRRTVYGGNNSEKLTSVKNQNFV